MARKPIERKVADTIQQKPLEIKIGSKTFLAPQPTYGTMVEISAIIAENEQTLEVSEEDITAGVLRYAKDSTYLADIVAVIILGAKRLRFSLKNAFLDIIFMIRYKTLSLPRKYLKSQIMQESTNADLAIILGTLLSSIDVKSFFVSITFLREINITKPTRVIETTASGQQSQVS